MIRKSVLSILNLGLCMALLFSVCRCSKKKETDESLNGVWQVTVKDASTQESYTYIYKFEDKKVTVIKSNDNTILSNAIEMRLGTYKRTVEEDLQRLTLTFEYHSCSNIVGLEKQVVEAETMTYEFTEGIDQMVWTLGLNKTMTLQRLTDLQIEHSEKIIKTSTLGCYYSNTLGKTVFQRRF